MLIVSIILKPILEYTQLAMSTCLIYLELAHLIQLTKGLMISPTKKKNGIKSPCTGIHQVELVGWEYPRKGLETME